MLGKLAAAQFSIEAVIAELERSGASPDAVRSQLQSLTDMRRAVGSATVADLAMLRASVASTVETAQQARTTAATETGARDLAGTSARTRAIIAGIADDLFERRIFDPYLQFASAEEEAEFRRREAERQAYIRAELAKDTPEGALNAANATVGQIEDAGAHGADRSPDYERLLGAASAAADEQRAAMGNATSIENAGAALAPDTRRYLAATGMRDAEIEATLSASSNPLDAFHWQTHLTASPADESANSLEDVAAALRAAGVVPPQNTVPQGHGITIAQQTVTERGGRLA